MTGLSLENNLRIINIDHGEFRGRIDKYTIGIGLNDKILECSRWWLYLFVHHLILNSIQYDTGEHGNIYK